MKTETGRSSGIGLMVLIIGEALAMAYHWLRNRVRERTSRGVLNISGEVAFLTHRDILLYQLENLLNHGAKCLGLEKRFQFLDHDDMGHHGLDQ